MKLQEKYKAFVVVKYQQIKIVFKLKPQYPANVA